MTALWYALRSKPLKENLVAQQCKTKGYEVFYPRLRVTPVNPRAKKVKPYFPGYLFVKADLDASGLSVFQWMPHAIGIVHFGGEPAPIPENLLHAIRDKVSKIAAAGGEHLEALSPGDPIKIEGGPFSGYTAIFDSRLPGTARVKVLLEFIGSRQVATEINAGHIRKV